MTSEVKKLPNSNQLGNSLDSQILYMAKLIKIIKPNNEFTRLTK